MFLIFDTETTGLPLDKNAPLTNFNNWPRMVQLAWQIHDANGKFVKAENHIIKPEGYIIPINASMVHGISTEHALNVGEDLNLVLDIFTETLKTVKYVVGHNVEFDLNVVGCEYLRTKGVNPLEQKLMVDTCTEKTANFCKLGGGPGRKFKKPKLAEIHQLLFNEGFDMAHNASADVESTARVFLELIRIKVLDNNDIIEDNSFFDNFYAANPDVIKPAGIKVVSNVAEAAKPEVKETPSHQVTKSPSYTPNHFTHLHVHSHFSILDGMSKVPDLIDKCTKNGMYSMALTDHGNMFGIKEFADSSNKYNGKIKDKIKEQEKILKDEKSTDAQKDDATVEIDLLKKKMFKPIFGMEAYCAPVSIDKRDGRADRGYHLIILAKNKQGYKSLCKLSSIAYVDGYYYNPRIDHSLLEQYHEGLIVTSACLGGELPQKIMNGDIEGAEKSLQWFKNLFGDDFYIELQRHKTDKPNADKTTFDRQQEVNRVLIELARKTNTKIIATNDVHFVEEEHSEAHDRLICLSTGRDFDDPDRMHYTKQEWLKSPQEMGEAFADLPEALENTKEIVDKVEAYSIDSDPIMPVFDIPTDFGTEEEYRQKFTEEDLFNEFTRNELGEEVMSREEAEKKIKKLGGYDRLYRIKLEADYLAKLAWEGAERRYGKELTDEQRERIVFELHIMKTMGFPGYFLIVQDYIRGAREELGVSVGPGRGSAAGSVVAYCLKITDVDPLKYDLLFERFLNPDRISLPDIDVDFDDDGRGKVLDWVTNKYGKEKVAHIITYGTMATKSSIADVGRVQKVPIPKVNEIKAFVPDKFPDSIKDEKGKTPKVNLKNCFKYVPEMKELVEGNDENISSMLTYAQQLEETNRQIGIHACGVIIGASDLTNYAPLCTIKDKDTKEDVLVTQYDGHVVETVGLIKMDFLGLKTLTQIKDALANIKKTRGIDVDIDNIPIDDEETYKLYSSGNTIGTFQFESPGMQKYLRELKPTVFEDLIAMNALYRPGPMDYIPTFIARKTGREPISYPIPIMEKYLKDTYGVTVYQEQVMLLSRQLANFTRGESDTLRKAMGKKLIEKMNELKGKFMSQGEANGHDPKILENIWKDWEKFASYAFNKSHATCYSWVAYQTAYLKAHYPAEFMAAVLNSCIRDSKEVVFMIEECRRMKIDVLGPNINESEYKFTVNKKGQICFGMGAVKSIGEIVIQSIIDERNANGPFKDFADFIMRVNGKGVNRKSIEALAGVGVFDSFEGMHRAMFYYIPEGDKTTFVEKAIKSVAAYLDRKNNAQFDLFADSVEDSDDTFVIPYPECEPWSKVKEIEMEKELVGFYMSAHPLDMYKDTIKYFANIKLENVKSTIETSSVDTTLTMAGLVASAERFTSKTGTEYGRYRIEDQSGSFEFMLFKENFMKMNHLMVPGTQLLVTGMVKERFVKVKEEDLGKVDPNAPKPKELRITKIELLESIMDSTNREVKFMVYTDVLDKEKTQEFINIIKEHKGKQRYSIHFVDRANKMSCVMHPSKGGVNAAEVFELLRDADYVTYDLKK